MSNIELIHTSYFRKKVTIVMKHNNIYYSTSFHKDDMKFKLIQTENIIDVLRCSLNKKKYGELKCLYELEKDRDVIIHKNKLIITITLIKCETYNTNNNKLFESEKIKLTLIEDDLYLYRVNYFEVRNINLIKDEQKNNAERGFDNLANNRYLKMFLENTYVEFIRFNNPHNFDVVSDPMKKSNKLNIKIYRGMDCKIQLEEDYGKTVKYTYLIDYGNCIVVKLD